MPLYNSDPLCIIGDMMIDESYRKQGIGELFIMESRKIAREFNVKKIKLNVFAKNQKAYNYFKHLGFDDMMFELSMPVE
jgi:GNAT superfamily N-acetyltransferase